ncbi:MAG: rRNA adenine dimethyltransferase family protein [Nitrososphaerales archaeon]
MALSTRRAGRRRALGQHYLRDPSVAEAMVRLAAIEEGDRVLEIGTGRGALTRLLADGQARLEAFELDESNYRATMDLGLDRLALHLGDGFAGPREFDVLVSSLPYSESSTFVEWLSGHRYRRAVVLLQRDFVEKLLAKPGDDAYRAISVVSQISSQVRMERDVPRESFEPPPRVSSVVVTVTPREVLSPEEVRLVKMLFSQRRRRLGGALRELGLEAGPLGAEWLSRRVRDLSPPDFRDLLRRVQGGGAPAGR